MCIGGYCMRKANIIICVVWIASSFVSSGEEICSKNSSVHWLVSSVEPQTDSKQNNHIGKRWLIDCRYNGSSSGDVLLLRRKTKNSTLQQRQPDGINVIKNQQMFTLLSLNYDDVGYYYCKVCNVTKYVGKLSTDTSRYPIVIYAKPRHPIQLGDNVIYTCSVKGVYVMTWYIVTENGSKIVMKSKDDSSWLRGLRYTRRHLVIPDFKDEDEQLYMCIIISRDKYTNEKEVYPGLQKHSIPLHRYYTSFSSTEIEGHVFHSILHVYSCHLPVIVSIMVLEPIKAVRWIQNFTADQSISLKIGKNSAYGIQMEMHIHRGGLFRDHLHVTAVLVNLESKQKWQIMNDKFYLKRNCSREKCHRTAVNKVECPRYLDDLDEKLNATFIMTLQDPCSKKFTLQIRDRSAGMNATTLMETTFENNTQTKMQLKGFNNDVSVQGRANFRQFFLTLVQHKRSKNTYRVELLLDMPDIGMRGHFVVMTDDFNIDDSTCPSPDGSGNDQTKTIAIVIISLFIAGLLLFAAVWMFRRYRHPSDDGFLLTSMEDEAL